MPLAPVDGSDCLAETSSGIQRATRRVLRGLAFGSEVSTGVSAQVSSPLLATEIETSKPLPASAAVSIGLRRSVAERGPATNTGTPPTWVTMWPKRRSVSLNDP